MDGILDTRVEQVGEDEDRLAGARTEEDDANVKGKMRSDTISILVMKILKVEKVKVLPIKGNSSVRSLNQVHVHALAIALRVDAAECVLVNMSIP